MSAPNPPLYARLRDDIVRRIVSGELRAGTMLPSEAALGAEFGASQGTARKALAELEQQGVVERRQGLGTFVAVTTPERALFHFFRLRRADGTPVVPELLSEELRRRRSTAAERRALDGAAAVFELRRLRRVEGRPAAVERIVIPVALFPGLPERAPLPNTLYALYQSAYGIAVVRADEELQAVAASEADAEALDLPPGAPLLQVNRQAIDLAGRVVELRRSRYRTDGLHYRIHLS